MIVVFASRFDSAASRLVERWRDRGACLLTCEDLSRRGWCYESAAPERSVAVVEERTVAVRAIRAVVMRLSAVTEHDLPHIVATERAYVATEMTAFVLAWLTSLRCPVFNRPTPLSLSGPSWPQERWIQQAAAVGLSVVPRRRLLRTAFIASGEPATGTTSAEATTSSQAPMTGVASVVTVVGRRCLGDPGGALDDTLVRGALSLATAAGVELMTATFLRAEDGTRFAGAVPWVDVSRPDVSDALFERLESLS